MQLQTTVMSGDELYATYDTKRQTNKTRPFLTKYEEAKVIGMRIEQLARGAPTKLPNNEATRRMSLRELAYKELEQNKLPFLVARTLANGDKEYWRLEDLKRI